MKTALKEKINKLPLTSGVYLMKSIKDKVIYVGKAISLRKRVRSYFCKKSHMNKTDNLVAEVDDIQCIETASEAEALILEAHLIKQYKPKYNIDLRDDKSYPYIELNSEDFPRISVERPREKNRKSIYYGPYINPGLIREALSIIRKIFRFRTCHPFPDKECLDYHIGLCDAPCIDGISKREYKKNIRHVQMILEGKKDQLLRNLNREMERCVKDKAYELAAKVRDQIRAIGALYSGTKDINYFKEAEQLKRALDLGRVPTRIETFDVSNIMGAQAVGSMVAFLNGKPDKQNYRRFRIKEVEGIDDFRMIAEVVRRRYRRLKNEGNIFPDLIVIDGGKGQLSAACYELEKLDVTIPIISLAKREEEVFVPKRRSSLKLAKDSLGLKLLQRMRDEAHRFAVSYHRKLRGKDAFSKKS
jgi:excinuclease ABC subunit C